MNPSHKSGNPWYFQRLLCGGKGSYPQCPGLVGACSSADLVAASSKGSQCLLLLASQGCLLDLLPKRCHFAIDCVCIPRVCSGLDLLRGGRGRGAASWPLSGSFLQPLSTRSVTSPAPGPALPSQLTSRAWSCWVYPGPGQGETFPVRPLPGFFNLCVSAKKPWCPADPHPSSSGRITSPRLWVLGEPMAVLACPARSVPGCGSPWPSLAHGVQLAEGAGGLPGASLPTECLSSAALQMLALACV